ncbi:MAG: HI0074 family nucleotidyltransferase substrate-binding subunit [FCB group bacterium]|jgi:nucleotidyltransferase substrate binding protein (TIGR01987 family)
MEKEARWKLRFENFEKALDSLKEVMEQKDLDNEIIIDASIQRFEVTFELAWKTLQDYLFEVGIIEFKGPKNIIAKAYQDNIIEDGQTWVDMHKDRNVLTHEYAFMESRAIFQRIKTSYIQAFIQFQRRLQDE